MLWGILGIAPQFVISRLHDGAAIEGEMDTMKRLKGINWTAIIVSLLTLALALLNIFNTLSSNKFEVLGISSEQFATLQLPFLLLTLGVFTLGIIPIRGNISHIETKLNRLVDASRFVGIERFRPQRNGYLSSLADILREAEHDVMLVGIGLGSLEGGPESTGLFDDPLRRGVTIRILLLTTYTTQGERNPVVEIADRQTHFSDNRSLINRRVQEIIRLRSSLPDAKKKKLEVKCYDNIPAAAAALCDAKEPHGMIRIEPIIPGVPTGKRPSFDVTAASSREFYRDLCECYERLWEEAIPAEKMAEFINKDMHSSIESGAHPHGV